MKRRIYVKYENLISALSLRDALNEDWLNRVAMQFKAIGVEFPTKWTKEKRDEFIMNFLNTTSVETVGANLSIISGKEMNNKEAMAVLYEIVEAVTIT